MEIKIATYNNLYLLDPKFLAFKFAEFYKFTVKSILSIPANKPNLDFNLF
jgi:hypothetical protein